MDEIPFRLIILILVVGGAMLKPWLERRKKRALEEQKGRSLAPVEAEATEEEERADGLKLPYENLVDEVFGPYMERRREAAKASRPAAPVAAPREAPRALPPTPPAPERTAEAARSKYEALPDAAAPVDRTIEERLFGNRSLSAAAKLVVAHEILQPPRMLRGRAGNIRR